MTGSPTGQVLLATQPTKDYGLTKKEAFFSGEKYSNPASLRMGKWRKAKGFEGMYTCTLPPFRQYSVFLHKILELLFKVYTYSTVMFLSLTFH